MVRSESMWTFLDSDNAYFPYEKTMPVLQEVNHSLAA